MENNALQKRQAPGTSLTLSDREKQIAKVIVHVNDLLDFKRDAEDVKSWAQDIERLAPGTDLEKLKFLLDCFKTEKLVWDKTKGIQNIFIGLKQIKKTDNGYETLKNIW